MKIEQLHSLFLKCNSVNTDTRKIKKGDIYFALKGETFNGNSFAEEALRKGAQYAIVDEKEFQKSSNTILVDDVLKALQNLAIYHRSYLNLPIIAITGSNGKTTTKELINATLSKKYQTVATIGNLNNHIGVPLTLLSMDKTTEIGIVEMGANHLKEIDFLCQIARPDYGYITNFGKAHLEGFGSLEGVIKGKTELYDYLIKHDKTIFINSNDEVQVEKTKKTNNVFSFGSKNSKLLIELLGLSPYVDVKFNDIEIHSQLIGEYNFNNITAAIAIAKYFEVSDIKIKKAIESYVPSNNRSQIIEKETHKILLDAYNANPTSMIAALRNFEKLDDQFKIVILGDMFELGKEAPIEHQSIADLASTLLIDKAILIGENFSKTKIISPKVMIFNSFEDFKHSDAISNLKNHTILIKGSRGMALERILPLLN
jgi:UDP-N-acetylmuramoyl-tripeptide--D-alanyl-D-alanine ligase